MGEPPTADRFAIAECEVRSISNLPPSLERQPRSLEHV